MSPALNKINIFKPGFSWCLGPSLSLLSALLSVWCKQYRNSTGCDIRFARCGINQTVRSLWCSRHTPEVSGFTAVQQKNIQEHPEHRVWDFNYQPTHFTHTSCVTSVACSTRWMTEVVRGQWYDLRREWDKTAAFLESWCASPPGNRTVAHPDVIKTQLVCVAFNKEAGTSDGFSH